MSSSVTKDKHCIWVRIHQSKIHGKYVYHCRNREGNQPALSNPEIKDILEKLFPHSRVFDHWQMDDVDRLAAFLKGEVMMVDSRLITMVYKHPFISEDSQIVLADKNKPLDVVIEPMDRNVFDWDI